jgi:hypothetical protein
MMLNKIFSGNQLHKLVIGRNRHFGKMEMVPETLVSSYNQLIWLIARED